MITKEEIIYNGKQCYRIRSDAHRYIVHGDETDICAICVPVDVDYPCEEGEEIIEYNADEILDILMGVSE